MKIDFRQIIHQLDGKPVKVGERKDRDWTLADVAVNALDGAPSKKDPRTGQPIPGEEIEGTEKHRRGQLQDRIYRAKEPIQVDAKDVALIKDLIAKVYPSPRIVYQTWEMLEGRKP